MNGPGRCSQGNRRWWAMVAMSGPLMAAVFALWSLSGCQANFGNPPSSGSRAEAVVIPLDDQPADIDAGAVVSKTELVDIGDALPSSGTTGALFALGLGDILIDTMDGSGESTQPVPGRLTIVFRVATSDVVDSCEDGVTAATFTVEVADGRAVSVDPPVAELDDGVFRLLFDGLFSLCTEVEATFSGAVAVERLEVRFGSDDASGNANDNGNQSADTGGNANDNAAADGNANDNAAGSTNDNANGDGNQNANSGGNANDNAAADGNTNANTGDDNGNANTASGNSNANSNGNANDNSGGNANDNASGNANENSAGSGADNSNGNANDNNAGNTHDNAGGNGNDNSGGDDNSGGNGNDNGN